MEALAQHLQALDASEKDVQRLKLALEELEHADLSRVKGRVARGLVDAKVAEQVEELCALAEIVMPVARAAFALADHFMPSPVDLSKIDFRPVHRVDRINGGEPDLVDFRRHVGDELARLDERERASWSALEELREIVNRLDQQVTRLVRTHPAGDADPEATDTKWLEDTVADLDDRIQALEKRGRAERLDAGFRELMEKEIAHLKEQIPGELANRLLQLERAARAADLMPAT